MVELVSLQNTGYCVLNQPTEASGQKTVSIVGVPRSGTSMIASALVSMGIHLGDQVDAAVLEDVEIAKALEASDAEQLEFLIRDRNDQHNIWGFKRPNAFRVIKNFEDSFRNIHYIIVFRDSLGVALRNNVSMRLKLLPALHQAAADNVALVAFVASTKAPTLLVSYEKAMLDAGGLVDAIAKFLDIDLSAESRDRVLQLLPGNREAYLLSSRVQYEGLIDAVSRTAGVLGWARCVGRAEPVRVRLLIDGIVKAVTTADLYRSDLAQAEKNEGRCAFSFPLTEDIRPLSKLAVEIVGSDVRLRRASARQLPGG